MATTVKFSPFKITAAEMEKVPIKDGQLFFLTDTREIFIDCGADEETANRIPIAHIPIASEDVVGGVRVDGRTIKINEQNIIYSDILSEWNPGVNYLAGELVLYNGNIYICINGVVGSDSNSFNADDWELFVTGLKSWKALTTYFFNEIVYYDNSIYLCTDTHVSTESFLEDRNLYWKNLVGARGDRGYSAYEIALQNNFVGTELDWLTSLKGETGSTTIKTTKEDLLISLPKENWVGSAPIYYQIIENEKINKDLNPRVDIVISSIQATGIKEQINFGYITRVETFDGQIIFYCYQDKPEIDLTVMVEVI